MTLIADKEILKNSIKAMVLIQPTFLKELVVEIEQDNQLSMQERLNKIVDEDFEEYDEVFKALA